MKKKILNHVQIIQCICVTCEITKEYVIWQLEQNI